jgi:hypothetical protein
VLLKRRNRRRNSSTSTPGRLLAKGAKAVVGEVVKPRAWARRTVEGRMVIVLRGNGTSVPARLPRKVKRPKRQRNLMVDVHPLAMVPIAVEEVEVAAESDEVVVVSQEADDHKDRQETHLHRWDSLLLRKHELKPTRAQTLVSRLLYIR